MDIMPRIPTARGAYRDYDAPTMSTVDKDKTYLEKQEKKALTDDCKRIASYKISECKQESEGEKNSKIASDRKEQKKKELMLSNELKSIAIRNELATTYCHGLLELYQFRYGTLEGFARFHRDSQSVKEQVTPGVTNGVVLLPDYTCTANVGWNPVTLNRTIKNGRPEEKNTIALSVIMSDGFKDMLIYLIQHKNDQGVSRLIKSVLDEHEFDELEKRYWANPEGFSTFQWRGWNRLRGESREYQPDEKLKKRNLKKLYDSGRISKEEMIHHLSNPAYGINCVLGEEGCISVEKTLREARGADLMVARDQGKHRWVIKKDCEVMQEMVRRDGRPVAGPSATSYRLMKIGRLCSNYLKNKLSINSDKELNKLLIANCVAYVVPDDHSIVEVEMSAQDLKLLREGQNIAQLFINV